MPTRTEEVEPKSSREEMDGELGEGWLVAMWAWIDAGESIVSSLPYFLFFLSFLPFRSSIHFTLFIFVIFFHSLHSPLFFRSEATQICMHALCSTSRSNQMYPER